MCLAAHNENKIKKHTSMRMLFSHIFIDLVILFSFMLTSSLEGSNLVSSLIGSQLFA